MESRPTDVAGASVSLSVIFTSNCFLIGHILWARSQCITYKRAYVDTLLEFCIKVEGCLIVWKGLFARSCYISKLTHSRCTSWQVMQQTFLTFIVFFDFQNNPDVRISLPLVMWQGHILFWKFMFILTGPCHIWCCSGCQLTWNSIHYVLFSYFHELSLGPLFHTLTSAPRLYRFT